MNRLFGGIVLGAFVLGMATTPVFADGARCNVNFGDQPTFRTADNGCLYQSPDGTERPGGIPEGWYADTDKGQAPSGSVIMASVATLRLNDPNQTVPLYREPVAQPQPAVQQPATGRGPVFTDPNVVGCPTTPEEADLFITGGQTPGRWSMLPDGGIKLNVGPVVRLKVPCGKIVYWDGSQTQTVRTGAEILAGEASFYALG